MVFDWLRDVRQQLWAFCFRSVRRRLALRRKSSRSLRSAQALESRVLLSAFTVNSLVDVPDVNPGDGISDDGSGNSSLRTAIMEANALPGNDTVLLGPGLYVLSLIGADEDAALAGDLDVTESLTIIGTGADTTIIDAAGVDRVFQVFAGASLNLRGLTITGGDVVGKGGGLYNDGHVSLRDSTVTGNSSADRGGGIYSATGADLNIADTTISNNTTDNRGGGIFSKGVLTIQGSSISGNTASVRAGGLQSTGIGTIINSTVFGNSAVDLAGGIRNTGVLTVANTTVSGNSAGVNGGGVQNQNTMVITASTITKNTAATGGGVFNKAGKSITLQNTIVAGNTATTADADTSGVFLTDGNNLIGDLGNATGFVAGVRGDQIGDAGSPIDPGLGPLMDNGGATLSHALLAGSPAIDAGDHTRAVRLNGRLPIIDEGTFAVAGVDSTVSSNGTVNINGPSVLRVPDWIPVDERPDAQANYYLYFANHRGDSIRMAWADSIGGPWTVFNYGTATDQSLSGRVTPGDGVLDLNLGADATIDLGAVVIDNHIASPDVRLDEVNQRIVMYFHSPVIGPLNQTTFVATSKFGLNFNMAADGGDVFPGETHGVREVALGRSYFKTFEVDGRAFALANSGKLFRGPATTSGGSPATIANADADGGLWNPPEGFDLTSLYWEEVPAEDNPINKLLVPEFLRPHVDPETDPDGLLRDFDASSGPRHSGVLYESEIDPDKIFVYYSGRYDAPESVMLAVIDLSGLSPAERQDPVNWVVPTGKEALVFSPEENWEGIENPFSDNGEPFSSGGDATGVQQLRDPDLYIDTDGLVYLFYSGAGEEAIGMALVVPQIDQSGNSRFGDVAADIGALEFTDDNAAWARHVIDSAIGGADGARFEDVNNDGLLDIAVGWEQAGISRAYLNPGPSGVKEVWPAVTVGVTPDVEDAVFADVDGDGAIDVVSATEGGNRQLMVNFAPADPADYTNSAMWTTVAFPTLSTPNAPSQRWMYSLVMDVNQDGNLDVVSGGKDDAKVGWFEAPEINKRDLSKWQYHEMGNVGWTMSLIESDMDGDGDSDIVLTDRQTDFGLQGARWLENPGSDGDQTSLWTNHFIGTQYEQTMFMTLADMDGDLDLDIVYPVANDQRVLWLERLDSTGDSWTEHVINGPANVGSGKAIEVADINNDGQLDLILSFANARNGKSGVVWLEYSNSVFDSDWVRHEISGPDGVKFDLVTMLDLDDDGDLDLVTTEEKGSDEIPELGVIWYENNTTQNTVPTLDAFSDLTINEDAPEQTVNLTGISAGGTESDPLRVTAISSNTGLIPNPTVTYTSPASNGSLQFAPVANQSGTATITVTVEDGGLDGDLSTGGDNATFSQQFIVAVIEVQAATISGRHLFYNNSRFDDPAGLMGDPSVNANDDGAIATDKVALQSGATATFANYTSYNRGINGIMVDIDRGDSGGPLTADDFEFRVGNTADPSTWAVAPAPNGFAVRTAAGVNGSDRVAFTWADGAIKNQWLQVTVKANANTGLANDDVHYWGHQFGETGNNAATTVNFDDTLLVLNNPSGFTPALIDNPYDINRDGRVNFDDTLLVLNNPSGFSSLLLFNPPAPPASGTSAAQAASPFADDMDATPDQPASQTKISVTEVVEIQTTIIAAPVDIQAVSDETISGGPEPLPVTQTPAIRPVPAAAAGVVNVVNGPRFTLRGIQGVSPVSPSVSVPTSTNDSFHESEDGKSANISHAPVASSRDEERPRGFGRFLGFGGLFRR